MHHRGKGNFVEGLAPWEYEEFENAAQWAHRDRRAERAELTRLMSEYRGKIKKVKPGVSGLTQAQVRESWNILGGSYG